VSPGLVLASRSPQRRTILEQLGVAFEVAVPSGVDELGQGPPIEVAVENAYRKAAAVAAEAGDGGSGGPDGSGAPRGPGAWGGSGGLVLGVDTVVALGVRMYGKPIEPGDAEDTLWALSGRTHTVISGVCLIDGDGRARTAAAETMVTFRTLTEDLIAWYVASEEWRERAGGYAIQGRGAALVERIEGDYTNVVGLPVITLMELAPSLLTLAR
jgi:septum formation protein